jgi:hypothetical protein
MVLIATEDELSERLACRLVMEARGSEEGIHCVGRRGFGYLKANLHRYQQTAKRAPVFVLTDLDRVACAPSLRRTWLRRVPVVNNLLFRIAVRETEAWLLADREAMAAFLRVPVGQIARNSEEINDPKRYLLDLAKTAPKSLRDDLLPKCGERSSQGYGYNIRMCEFVERSWSSRRAVENNESLRRAVRRLSECFTAN